MAFLLWFKTLLMKTVLAPRITILSVCMIVLQQVGLSQGFSSAHKVKSSDNLHSEELISALDYKTIEELREIIIDLKTQRSLSNCIH